MRLTVCSGHLLFGADLLAACRTWGVESENQPQRGLFLPGLQAHSSAMGQKDGEKWAAAADLQPTTPKSDRLLVSFQASNAACSLALKPDGVVASRRHSPSYDSSGA